MSKLRMVQRGYGPDFGCAVGIDGKPVRRTRWSHPYSYDTFVIWRGGENSEANGSAYSDRMFQWDYEKMQVCCKRHLEGRQIFSSASPDTVQTLLRDYFDAPGLRLIVFAESCNVATGYPLWFFMFHTPRASEDATSTEAPPHTDSIS